MDRSPAMPVDCPGADAMQFLDVSELRLILIGESAAVKRAAVNTILGTVGKQPSTPILTQRLPEIKHSQCRQGEVAGRWVTLVETTDWFCSGLSEKDMRQDAGLCVRLSAPGPHAFILVLPAELSEGVEKRMLEEMEDIFGEACWGHTLLLFTQDKGLREGSVEELLRTGSQELQQLVDKCGNRCHLLSVEDRPDDTNVTRLLEKIEKLSRNRERIYSSEVYQETERLREEEFSRAQLDKSGQDFLKKMKEESKQIEIAKLHEKIQELEMKMKAERDELKKPEMERDLERTREERDRERREMEERHREEMWEMKESYESKARAEAEKNLIKVILLEQQRKMEAELNKLKEENKIKTERKEREMETLKQSVQLLQTTLAEERERQRQRNLIQVGIFGAVAATMLLRR